MVNQTEVIVIAELKAVPGQGAALRQVLEEAIAPSRAEKGNRLYHLHEEQNDPTRFFFYERWCDQAAFDAHMTAPHTNRLIERAGPLLAAPPQISQLRGLTE